MPPARFSAVLFDCDGVLVDSEPITMRVLRDQLALTGWDMTLAEAMRRFVGKAVRDERAAIEHHTGRPLTEDWMAHFYALRNAALAAEVQAMPGALAAVESAHTLTRGRIACASGADRAKVELQLRQCGLTDWFGRNVFSGHEMPRTKPAPDVYQAAMRVLNAQPADCLVIEDTVTGVQAGVAAGATVWVLCPDGADFEPLRQAGARLRFASMADLPALWANALTSAPQSLG